MQSYQLVLHDFSNLTAQLLRYSDDKEEISEECERMNFLFATASSSNQFVAEVYPIGEQSEEP